jgi:hypothetical protein
MNNIVGLVNTVIKNNENIMPDSLFYKEYRDFSTEYDKLLKTGLVKKRESQICSITDIINISYPAYNLSNQT